MKLICTLALFFIAYSFSYSQQLVYTPKNPFLGGNNPFYYQQLLAAADSQNSFTDPNAVDEDESDLEEFQEALNRQLLDQITRSVLGAQLGDGLQEGTFTVGDLSLEIFSAPEGLVINILDTRTGEQTQIIIPN